MTDSSQISSPRCVGRSVSNTMVPGQWGLRLFSGSYQQFTPEKWVSLLNIRQHIFHNVRFRRSPDELCKYISLFSVLRLTVLHPTVLADSPARHTRPHSRRHLSQDRGPVRPGLQLEEVLSLWLRRQSHKHEDVRDQSPSGLWPRHGAAPRPPLLGQQWLAGNSRGRWKYCPAASQPDCLSEGETKNSQLHH